MIESPYLTCEEAAAYLRLQTGSAVRKLVQRGELRAAPGGRACICEFRSGCNGLGTLHCEGCGGDLCVCRCGGEIECPGCIYCGELGDFDLSDCDDSEAP